ncbi:MAG TPA: trigger factor [Patescibacteria group bacterium]
MAKAHPKEKSVSKITSTVATTEDGSVQITFSIPKKVIEDAQEKIVLDYQKNTTIAGFRKGNAPLEKVKAKIGEQELTEKCLAQILPLAYSEAVTANKIKPITYPKFELLSQGDTWQVRATTALFPEIELGDYKKTVEGALRAASLKKELTKEEKEQKVISTLLETVKVKLPRLLIDEEVNTRLSSLLARIEKLGLNLDSYLASIGKTGEGLRNEYEKQVKEGITIELALNKIAENEAVEVSEKQVDDAIKATGVEAPQNPEQKLVVKSVLRRRAALDRLMALV